MAVRLSTLNETPNGLRAESKPHITSKAVQRALLVATVAFGVLSVVPPLRFAGSLGLRSVAFLAACNGSAASWQNASKLDRALLVGKVALVVLGIVGAVLVSPAIIVASIAADTALQMQGLVSAFKDKKYDKALIHLAVITVNVLAIAALVTGSWQLIVAACAISVLLMLCLAVKMFLTTKEDPGAWIDVLGYVALAGIGIAGCVTMAQVTWKTPETVIYDLKNNSKYTHYYYDKHGLVATLKPGESVHLEVPFDNLGGKDPSLTMKGDDIWGGLGVYSTNIIFSYSTQAPIAASDIPYSFPSSISVEIPRQLYSKG